MRLLAIAAALLANAHSVNAGESAATGFPVPVIAIRTGDTLTEDLVTERRLFANATALRTHFTARDSVVGKVARRPLAAGAAIPLNALREAYVFKEGERVQVEYSSGTLSIRVIGVALQPGLLGAHVRVRNIDTGVTVNGTVRSDGTVEVKGQP